MEDRSLLPFTALKTNLKKTGLNPVHYIPDRSKIVLVQPPVEDFYLTRKRTQPSGLASIAACVRKKGFEVEILDCLATKKSRIIEWPDEFSYLKPFYGKKDVSGFCLFHEFKHFGYQYQHIAQLVRKKQPFVVGISSLFTAYSNEAIKTAKAIKKNYPECTIVMGGHHPTMFPEQVLACPEVDFVLRGEGETGMARLCTALRDGSSLKHVPGIAFRDKPCNFVSPPFWAENLDDLPLPASDLIDSKFYKKKKRSSIMVISSRGCPMKCSYCSVSASSLHGPFRQRKIEDVVREIRSQMENHDIGFIDFEDENLCLKKQWFISLFTQIKELCRGTDIELRAMNGLFPPSVDEKIICLMKEAGFKTLNLSLGSTSKAQLERFRRPDVRPAFEKAVELAARYRLECVSYIIAAGPGQSAESCLDDLLYLAGRRTLVGLSIYYPAPGSSDYRLCASENLLPENFSQMRSSAFPLDSTTSRVQAVTLVRLSRILNFLKAVMDETGKIPAPAPFSEYEQNKPFDRHAVSKKLVQAFLYDGRIRGVTPEGQVFFHLTDENLTQKFIKKIRNIRVRGIKSA